MKTWSMTSVPKKSLFTRFFFFIALIKFNDYKYGSLLVFLLSLVTLILLPFLHDADCIAEVFLTKLKRFFVYGILKDYVNQLSSPHRAQHTLSCNNCRLPSHNIRGLNYTQKHEKKIDLLKHSPDIFIFPGIPFFIHTLAHAIFITAIPHFIKSLSLLNESKRWLLFIKLFPYNN